MSRERFDRIRVGSTTRAEVSDLLGRPQDPYGAPVWTYFTADYARVTVDFDSAGVVIDKSWQSERAEAGAAHGSAWPSG